MKSLLIITNGSSAVDVLEQGNISADFLPWLDVLHEGPVPADLSLSELSKIRANYISSQGWASEEEVNADFNERNQKLESYQNYAKVILWFEHDLYDQLQILQILNWFADQATLPTQFSIICTEQYVGLIKLGKINSFFQYEQTITQQHLLIAQIAWRAFCSNKPQDWENLLQEDTSILPFLHDAILRQLEEYPAPKTGLSRTQRQALQIIAKNEITAINLFEQYQETEQRRFLGDLSFWSILQQMLDSTPPLIQLTDNVKTLDSSNPKQKLFITPIEPEVLQENSNFLDYHQLNRWLGGVHLNSENRWIWSKEAGLEQ